MSKLPPLEDSGIDSEDRQSSVFDESQMVSHKSKTFILPTKHMEDLEVAFRGAGAPVGANVPEVEPRDSDDGSATVRTQPPNTCRILQRKLELKVERAKRNYSQYQEDSARKSQSANLIPISRLPIPGDLEQKPLVDYKSESSDEPEEISFFPAKLKSARMRKLNTELSDTFSIQEMTIDSELDSDDSGSQNLELLPPTMKKNLLDTLKTCFGCSYKS